MVFKTSRPRKEVTPVTVIVATSVLWLITLVLAIQGGKFQADAEDAFQHAVASKYASEQNVIQAMVSDLDRSSSRFPSGKKYCPTLTIPEQEANKIGAVAGIEKSQTNCTAFDYGYKVGLPVETVYDTTTGEYLVVSEDQMEYLASAVTGGRSLKYFSYMLFIFFSYTGVMSAIAIRGRKQGQGRIKNGWGNFGAVLVSSGLVAFLVAQSLSPRINEVQAVNEEVDQGLGLIMAGHEQGAVSAKIVDAVRYPTQDVHYGWVLLGLFIPEIAPARGCPVFTYQDPQTQQQKRVVEKHTCLRNGEFITDQEVVLAYNDAAGQYAMTTFQSNALLAKEVSSLKRTAWGTRGIGLGLLALGGLCFWLQRQRNKSRLGSNADDYDFLMQRRAPRSPVGNYPVNNYPAPAHFMPQDLQEQKQDNLSRWEPK